MFRDRTLLGLNLAVFLIILGVGMIVFRPGPGRKTGADIRPQCGLLYFLAAAGTGSIAFGGGMA